MFFLKKTVAAITTAATLAAGSVFYASAAARGDINNDGIIDSFDVVIHRKIVVHMFSGGQTDLHYI